MYEAYSTSEVAFKLPAAQSINSIAFHRAEKRILLAGNTCDLLSYVPAKSGRRGFEVELAKRFSRKPVQAIKVVDDSNYLLSLSDQILSLHSLSHPFPVRAIVPVKNVSAFTAHIDKKTAEFYVTVASKRRFHVMRWNNDDFKEQSNFEFPPLPDNPTLFIWCGRSLCYAVRDSYNIIGMTFNELKQNWSGDNRKLYPVGEVPGIVELPDRAMAGFIRGEQLSLVPTKTYDHLNRATSSTPQLPMEMLFTDKLVAVAYDAPYLLGLLPRGRVEIRSFSPNILVQSIALNKAILLAPALTGQVLVASSFDVWLLDTAANLRRNVGTLIQERHFDLAVQVADHSDALDASEKIDLKRQAADNLFAQRKFEEAFTLHASIHTDVITVLQLFPDVLPEVFRSIRPGAPPIDWADNEKKRIMLALCSYLSAVRTSLAQQLEAHRRAERADKAVTLSGAPLSSPSPSPSLPATRLSKDDFTKVKTDLQLVDTTLLQCYLKTNPIFVDSLLRLHDNLCSFEDAECILKKATQVRSLYVLYETRRKHSLALALLKEQASLAPKSEPFFHGVDRTVEYLQASSSLEKNNNNQKTLGNVDLPLIFEYARWVLSEDPEAGITIFTGDESELARNLDREKVMDFLEQEAMHAVIPYLEHVIYKWSDGRPRLHEALLEHYVRKVKDLLRDYTHVFRDDENVIRAGQEEGDLGLYRRKLLKFLHTSLSYSPNTILVQLNHRAFCEERALIYGRLKKHEEALSIYTGVLHDIEAAEKYCSLYYNAADPIDSQVYLHLIRAYMCPMDPALGVGLSSSPISTSSKDDLLPAPTPNVTHAVRVLGRHADKMDAVAALALIPDDTLLCGLSTAFNALVHSTANEAAEVSVRRAMSEVATQRTERKLMEVSSTRLLITPKTECVHCGKKIANSAFVRDPTTGDVKHHHCSNEDIGDRETGRVLSPA